MAIMRNTSTPADPRRAERRATRVTHYHQSGALFYCQLLIYPSIDIVMPKWEIKSFKHKNKSKTKKKTSKDSHTRDN